MCNTDISFCMKPEGCPYRASCRRYMTKEEASRLKDDETITETDFTSMRKQAFQCFMPRESAVSGMAMSPVVDIPRLLVLGNGDMLNLCCITGIEKSDDGSWWVHLLSDDQWKVTEQDVQRIVQACSPVLEIRVPEGCEDKLAALSEEGVSHVAAVLR